MDLLQDLRLFDDALEFVDDQVVDPDLLADQILCLVLRVVCVAESAVVADLELEEFVPEPSMFVADVVTEVELFAAGR